MYYANLNDLAVVEPTPPLPEVSLFPEISASTKKIVVYGAIGLVAASFLLWLATRK